MSTEGTPDRESRFYETLVEVSPTAIVTCDPTFTVTGWNPAAERLFAWTREEALGPSSTISWASTTRSARRPPR